MYFIISLFILISNIGYSSSKLNLIGQIISSKKYKSVAIFKVNDRIISKRIGEFINGYRIYEIKYRYIYLHKNKEIKILMVGQEPIKSRELKGIERVGDNVLMTRQLRDYISNDNLATVMMQAASEAYYDAEWRLMGFRLLEIERGSIYDIVGIENNDIITHINGIRLNGVLIAFTMLKNVKDSDSFTFTYLRDNIETQVNIDITL